jgi:hypothetical protein
MMTNLSWSALLVGVLGALAWWNAEDRGGGDESRPVFGAMPCRERHKATCKVATCKAEFGTVAELESARRSGIIPPARP